MADLGNKISNFNKIISYGI